MKTFIIFLTLIIFSTVNVYSKEVVDCRSLKKNSPKYLICKTKIAGSAMRSNLAKKLKLSNKIDNESSIERFGEAKSGGGGRKSQCLPRTSLGTHKKRR